MSDARTCTYCGAEKCGHRYLYGRAAKGCKKGFAVKEENVTAQTTIGEMREEMSKMLGKVPDDTQGVWTYSFTKRGSPLS